MGCGGSRADALEPRYYESWTRETETTWLTTTDAESCADDGAPARANTARVLEAASSHREKKMVNIGTQCGKQLGCGGKHQRRPGGREEVKKEAKKMATKERSVAKATQLVTSGEAIPNRVK